MSTYIAVLSNAGKPSKIVRPSALDLDVLGDIPKRYRGGETASDRARRKREWAGNGPPRQDPAPRSGLNPCLNSV